jgi:hypothetical protein
MNAKLGFNKSPNPPLTKSPIESHHHIDHPTRHKNHFFGRIPLKPFLHDFQAQGGLFGILRRNIGWQFEVGAKFPIDLDGVVDGVRFQVFFVQHRPSGITNRGLVAQQVPKFLCNVRAKGREETTSGSSTARLEHFRLRRSLVAIMK